MNKTKKQKQITWDTLKWKDVLIDNDGDEKMVLGVRNDLVDISSATDFEKYLYTYHKKELQEYYYTIKQATTVEKVITVKGKRYQLIKE